MSYFRPLNDEVATKDNFMSASALARLARSENRIQPSSPADHWIPVSKRIPTASGDYLVLLRGERHRLMSFDGGEKKFSPRSLNQVVTHWMPLPPAPQQQG